MKIKFWGVRGSIPCPGPSTIKYGGNTACIELRFEDTDRRVIIDAGSGIRELGNYMMANDLSKGPIKTEIFLTHTHWDHIMGFPFFTPGYVSGTKLKIYGPVSYENDSLEDVMGWQLTYRHFPVRQAELASEIEYINLKENRFDLGDGITLTTKYLNHPVLCLGYRFEYRDKIFCTAYDTEPFQNIFCTDHDDPSYNEAMAHEGDQAARQKISEWKNLLQEQTSLFTTLNTPGKNTSYPELAGGILPVNMPSRQRSGPGSNVWPCFTMTPYELMTR